MLPDIAEINKDLEHILVLKETLKSYKMNPFESGTPTNMITKGLEACFSGIQGFHKAPQQVNKMSHNFVEPKKFLKTERFILQLYSNMLTRNKKPHL